MRNALRMEVGDCLTDHQGDFSRLTFVCRHFVRIGWEERRGGAY
jgi:hypothetical protein